MHTSPLLAVAGVVPAAFAKILDGDVVCEPIENFLEIRA